MAFDKVIDSAQLETAIKATADAIREKTGTADPIAWLEELGFSEAIAAIEAGGGSTLWNGGKFTTGSFVLAEETTSEYVIATKSDNAMLDLLNDGESLADQQVHNSIGLLVVGRPKSTSLSTDDKAKCMWISVYAPVHFGGSDGSGYTNIVHYWDSYASVRGTSGGAYVYFDSLQVKFTSNIKGSPNFEYLWLAWRGVV